jgi:RHS repeat-associated protein
MPQFHPPHYPPFGSSLPNRTWSDANRGYRFGFNGKEKDSEGMGGGESTYDYGFRIYNPNLGKFLSVDPLSFSYPWYTPYQFAGNKVIIAIDIDGLEEYIIIDYPSNDGCIHSKLKLVDANSPFKISYYSSTVPFDGTTFPTDLSKANLISTVDLTNINFDNGHSGFRSLEEFNGAYITYKAATDKEKKSNLNNYNWKICSPPLVPSPSTSNDKKEPIKYKGQEIKKGSVIKMIPSIGWLGTKKYGPSAKNGVLGELSKEGKKELELLATSINSLKKGSINTVQLAITWDIGTKTYSQEESKTAFETINKVNENAINYLKSKLNDKGISVSGSTNITTTGDSKNNTTKANIN